MVRPGKGLQCPGNGPIGTKSRRSLQLLLAQIHNENSAHARRPGNMPRLYVSYGVNV